MIDATDRWTLWENQGGRYVVIHHGATFNHATGFLYRAQQFGEPTLSVFDIQRTLTQDSGGRVRHRQAIRNDWAANYRTERLAREAFHQLQVAGHHE